jgi:hypothetical protein
MHRWFQRGRVAVVAGASFVLLVLVLPQIATGIGLGALAGPATTSGSCGSSGSGSSGSGSTCGPLAISAQPDTKLVDTEAVVVTGSGFTPNAVISLAHCKAGATAAAGCDVSNLLQILSSGSGSFVTTYDVSRIIYTQTPSGASVSTDCATAPCMLGAADSGDLVVAAVTPLSFNRKVPPVFQAALDPTDKVSTATGAAEVAGTFVCRRPAVVQFFVDLDQHRGRFNVQNQSFAVASCKGSRSWKVAVPPGILTFAPGKASAAVALSAEIGPVFRTIPLTGKVTLVASSKS